MSLRFIDSFDHYSTAQITRKWTELANATIAAAAGRHGACMRTDQSTRYVRKTLDASYGTLIVGVAVKWTGTISGNSGSFIAFGDLGSDQCSLRTNSDGTISFRRGSTIVATSAASIAAGTWYFIEFKVVFSNTGSYEVRVNGVNILSASGVDTTNTSNNQANSISLNMAAGATIGGQGLQVDWDDLYVCDGGGSVNNDFLGDVRVDAYFPNGNGNSSQWVGSDGNSTDNYLLVDETSPNDDTDYVASATVSNKDTYAFGNMAHTPSSIHGLQINMHARKDDSGLRTIQSVTRSGGSDTDGTAVALATTFVNHMQISETDPNTAAAWTQSGFDAAEFGVKVAA